MKKSYFPALWLIIFVQTITAQLSAQPFEITFGMKGKTVTPDSVYVENLQKGTNLMLLGGDVLLLTTPTIAIDFTTGDSDLTIFPNPVKDRSTIRFFNPQSGIVSLKLVDITGRQIAIQKENLPSGQIQYLVSGLPPGTFLLQVRTLSQSYSKALISTGSSLVNPCLILQCAKFQALKSNTQNKQIKSGQNLAGIKPMEYSKDDVLTFRAYFTGAETEVDTLVPSSDFELEFGIFYYTLTDYDLNTYLAVAIGNQVWMAENLKVTHYPNGTQIPLKTDDEFWKHVKDKSAEDGYCYYANDKDSADYGLLYSWPAALGNKGIYSDTNPSEIQGVCPAGWHLPSYSEWKELKDFISQDQHFLSEGQALKSRENWAGDLEGTDDYGFCALPGGQRGYMLWPEEGGIVYYGNFIGKGNNALWWSSTFAGLDVAFNIRLVHVSNKIEFKHEYQHYGLSIRCVRDLPASNLEGN